MGDPKWTCFKQRTGRRRVDRHNHSPMELEDFHAQLARGDLWIFGYGSLIWSPGFGYKE